MTSGEGRRAEAIYALLFTGTYFALGAQMAFLQVWYGARGLSKGEIGLISVLAFAVKVVAAIALPAAADRAGRVGAAIALIGLVGAAAAATHLLAPTNAAQTIYWIAPLSLMLAASFAGLIPLGDAACWAAAERGAFSYRRPRAVGSFAFLVATSSVGLLVGATDVDAVPFVIAGALLIAMIAGVLVAPSAPRRADGPRPSLIAGVKLLARRRFALIVAAASAIQASHAVFYVYGSIHWTQLGFSEGAIGALWSWGVLAEIGLFAIGGRVIGRLGAPAALGWAGAIAGLRWLAMSFDPGVAGAAALQTLHAASFALTHLAALALIAREAPVGLAGSAQGVLAAASGGVAMMTATSIAAWAFPLFGGGAYWIGVGFALLGAGLARLLAATPIGDAPKS